MVKFFMILHTQLLLLRYNLQTFSVQSSVLRVWSQICTNIQSNYGPRKTPRLIHHCVTPDSRQNTPTDVRAILPV